MSTTRSRLHVDSVGGKQYTATYKQQADGTWKGEATVADRKFTVIDPSLDMAMRAMEDKVNTRSK